MKCRQNETLTFNYKLNLNKRNKLITCCLYFYTLLGNVNLNKNGTSNI